MFDLMEQSLNFKQKLKPKISVKLKRATSIEINVNAITLNKLL